MTDRIEFHVEPGLDPSFTIRIDHLRTLLHDTDPANYRFSDHDLSLVGELICLILKARLPDPNEPARLRKPG